MIRLSVDELVAERHGRYGIDYPEPQHGGLEAPIVAEVTERVVELVRAGRSWCSTTTCGWRMSVRPARSSSPMPAACGSCCFRVTREVLLARLAERNGRAEVDGATLLITPSALDDFFGGFDEPQGDGEEMLVQQRHPLALEMRPGESDSSLGRTR